MGAPELDEQCRQLLWEHKDSGGFEKALSVLQKAQTDPAPGSPLARMEAAIRSMFDDMNRGFLSDDFQFELTNEVGSNSILQFLARFDAIFTLNQDLLLEIGYCRPVGHIPQAYNQRWSGLDFPGTETRVQPTPLGPTSRWAGSRCPSRDVQSVSPANAHTQPIYKLHGSSNWVDERGQPLLVMGGDKSGSIQGSRILSLYMQEFERRLREPDTHIMIIGYGFGDNHINLALNQAAESGGLKAFIIDPAGADAPDLMRDRLARLKSRGPQQPIQRALIGASRRPLNQIFTGDTIERDKVLRFFGPVGGSAAQPSSAYRRQRAAEG